VSSKSFVGGTGFQPVVSGVAPETGGTATYTFRTHFHPQSTPAAEIRRDAGFDGRDARSTHFETRPNV
jgi:hypothetical protein